MIRKAPLVTWMTAAVVFAGACSSSAGSANGEAPDVATPSLAPGSFDCAYNHAYQENYENDRVATILEDARSCYVLVDPDEMSNPATQIAEIKTSNQVGCYMSVGTGEDWRRDFTELADAISDTEWDEWPGEYFVTSPEIALPIMDARLARFAELGCQWVEFDNMDWDFDEARRLNYVTSICHQTHELDMFCMAKNSTLGQSFFDGLTLESYTFNKDWWDRSEAKSVLAAELPLLIVHYDDSECGDAEREYRETYGDGFTFLCEDPAVGGYRHPTDE